MTEHICNLTADQQRLIENDDKVLADPELTALFLDNLAPMMVAVVTGYTGDRIPEGKERLRAWMEEQRRAGVTFSNTTQMLGEATRQLRR